MLTRLVVDASIAVKWLVAEDGSEVADRLLGGDDELHAPRLLASEIANALWRKVRLGEIERSEAGAMMAAVTDMPLRWNTDETLCAEATRLAIALDRPVYDCVYLALAYRLNALLITADMRFVNALAATEHGTALMRLSDYKR